MKPGELPVQSPDKFKLVVNLKTAKALGLKVPLLLLRRAHKIIELWLAVCLLWVDSVEKVGGCDARISVIQSLSSFKGYYRVSERIYAALIRPFVQFDGEGDAANARLRAIGGHPAVLLRAICLRQDPDSPYADSEGYVPFGKLENYAGGRSNGFTSWSWSDAGQIIPMMEEKPTTLYIYPESDDIDAVAQAVKSGRSLSRTGLYWNASCLKEIHTPKFWPKETLEPILAQYKRDHPAPPQKPIPICKGR
jgi:hypothetical protein